MKIKIVPWDELDINEIYENCEDLIGYLKSLNIYRGEFSQVYSYPWDMLTFFENKYLPISDELILLVIKYPHLLKVFNKNET